MTLDHVFGLTNGKIDLAPIPSLNASGKYWAGALVRIVIDGTIRDMDQQATVCSFDPRIAKWTLYLSRKDLSAKSCFANSARTWR